MLPEPLTEVCMAPDSTGHCSDPYNYTINSGHFNLLLQTHPPVNLFINSRKVLRERIQCQTYAGITPWWISYLFKAGLRQRSKESRDEGS